jgi:hypothetical protein
VAGGAATAVVVVVDVVDDTVDVALDVVFCCAPWAPQADGRAVAVSAANSSTGRHPIRMREV